MLLRETDNGPPGSLRSLSRGRKISCARPRADVRRGIIQANGLNPRVHGDLEHRGFRPAQSNLGV